MLRHFFKEMFGSFWEVARHIFTALCVKFMVSLKKVLALVRVRLKIEVFWMSKFKSQGAT